MPTIGLSPKQLPKGDRLVGCVLSHNFAIDIDISISAGHLSNLLIKNHQGFETEKEEICEAGLGSSPWQHLDQTSARVALR